MPEVVIKSDPTHVLYVGWGTPREKAEQAIADTVALIESNELHAAPLVVMQERREGEPPLTLFEGSEFPLPAREALPVSIPDFLRLVEATNILSITLVGITELAPLLRRGGRQHVRDVP